MNYQVSIVKKENKNILKIKLVTGLMSLFHLVCFAILYWSFINFVSWHALLFVVMWVLYLISCKTAASLLDLKSITKIGRGFYAVLYGTLLFPETFFVLLIIGANPRLGGLIALIYILGYYFNPFFFPRFLSRMRLIRIQPTGQP